jgi:hypothetical protein
MPELERLFLTDVASQLARANETFDEDKIRKVLEEENQKIQSAIESKNLTQALMLTPGKELLKTFTGLVGVVDSNALARAARRHLSIENYPQLINLRKKLCQKMSITTTAN